MANVFQNHTISLDPIPIMYRVTQTVRVTSLDLHIAKGDNSDIYILCMLTFR